MKFLLISFLLSGLYSHDIQVAFFKISEENEKISLEIKFEKKDIESTFDKSGLKLNAKNINKYLIDHLSLSINDQQKNLSFDEIEIKHKHILVVSNIADVHESIKSISLKNTCLLDIDNHSNIIEVRLNESERDFLMNDARTYIDIEF